MFKLYVMIILSFCLFIFSNLMAVAPVDSEPDKILSKQIDMEILGKKSNYKLKSNIEVQTIYSTERSLKDGFSVIPEDHFEKITKIKAYHNGKKISKDLISDIYPKSEDAFFNSSRLHIISNPFNMKIGDTLKYTYREEIEDIVYCPIFQIESDLQTMFYEININHPSSISLDFDIVFSRDSIPVTIERPSVEQTILRFRDIPNIQPLSYYDHNSWQAKVNIRFYENGNLLSPATPQAFVDWYQTLTTLHPLLNESEKQTLQAELDSLATTKDKLRFIHNFVKNNFRYVADVRPSHSITPYSPSIILGSKYGDCKDRACLVSAIAFEAGIDVTMAVVTSVPFVDYNFTHPFLYNHVICYYEDEMESFFFDPTAKYYNFDFTPEYLGQRQALVLDPNNPKTSIIQSSIDSTTLEVLITGNSDSLGQSKAIIVMRNQLQALIRTGAQSQTNFEHNNFLNNLINSYFYKIDFKNFVLISSNDTASIYTADVDLGDFVISGKDKKYIPKIPFTLFDKEILTRENDSLPLHFDKIIRVMLSIDLQFDSVNSVLDSLILSPVKGVYFSSNNSIIDNNHLLIQYQYYRQNKIMTHNIKNEFLAFCKEYISSKNKMYIVNRMGE